MKSELKKEYEMVRNKIQEDYFILDGYLYDSSHTEDYEQIILKKIVLSDLLKYLDKTINPPNTIKPQRQTEEIY